MPKMRKGFTEMMKKPTYTELEAIARGMENGDVFCSLSLTEEEMPLLHHVFQPLGALSEEECAALFDGVDQAMHFWEYTENKVGDILLPRYLNRKLPQFDSFRVIYDSQIKQFSNILEARARIRTIWANMKMDGHRVQ